MIEVKSPKRSHQVTEFANASIVLATLLGARAAAFVDGRWLVERAALVVLLTFAGVAYPAQDQ
jgi:hypothetical protein